MPVTPVLAQIIRTIEVRNPVHAKKLASHLAVVDSSFEQEFCVLLDRYFELLKPEGRDLDFVIDCYLKMLDDIVAERVEFLRTGRYSSSSFDEVNKRVYGNLDVMAYYMHGLFLSQFLWHQHHKIYGYFLETIRAWAARTKAYLEIGGGHGLYLRAFCSLSRPDAEITVVDISPTSLRICREMAAVPSVRYIEADIHTFPGTAAGYDFITIGEVLEHVENPARLLRKLRELCSDQGVVFMTTPTNAPAIDHIYLFRDVQHIRDLIADAGFEVLHERAVLTEETTPKRAAAARIATLYGALLAPLKK